MTYICARPGKLLKAGRALLYVSLASVYPACRQCPKSPEPAANEFQEQGQSLASERLLDYLPKNCRSDKNDIPLLFGHYFNSAPADAELSIKDILANKNAELVCPPGPFLVDGNHAVDIDEKKWALSNLPDYFLWYTPANPEHYEFYLTTQNGFPLKAQSLKLNQEQDSLLVLLPKNKLESGKTYYLYLVQKSGQSKQTWIQPLQLAKI
jgi:hypothetical protein